MTGASISIRSDDAVVRRAVAALMRRALSLRPALEEIGASLLTSTQKRFEDEEGPDNESWPELARSTQAAPHRGRRRGDKHILQRSRLLHQSLTYDATNTNVAVGPNKGYAAIHQFGGEDDMAPGPAAIPARPYLGIDDDDRNEIAETFSDHLEGALS